MWVQLHDTVLLCLPYLIFGTVPYFSAQALLKSKTQNRAMKPLRVVNGLHGEFQQEATLLS